MTAKWASRSLLGSLKRAYMIYWVQMRRLKASAVKAVTLFAFTFLFISIYTVYLNFQCDFQEGRAAVTTAGGRKIIKFDPDLAVKNYGSLARCSYQSNGNLLCDDVRELGETVLRQTQLATIRMLAVFDAICKKHNIRYWMWRGALLGAARHDGFIPWDNELDIGIMKADYEKFRLHSNELPADIFLQNATSDLEYGKQRQTILAKLRDNKGCFGYCERTGCNFHDGLMIDIFGFEDFEGGLIRETTDNQVNFQIEKTDIFPLKEHIFEGFNVFIPNNHDVILSKTYGSNYNDIPPRDQRCPPGQLLGLPWTSCKDLERMNDTRKRYHLYLSKLSKMKFLGWYF